jgi:hypothetical protein
LVSADKGYTPLNLSDNIIEALGGKTALSRKHHSEINQFEII